MGDLTSPGAAMTWIRKRSAMERLFGSMSRFLTLTTTKAALDVWTVDPGYENVTLAVENEKPRNHVTFHCV